MAHQIVVFRADFRARGYTNEDIADLQNEIAEIAPIRLRGVWMPEAGGVYEFIPVVEFIGENLAKGGVAWVGGQVVARLVKGVSAWWKRRTETPEISSFSVSFDDVQVDFRSYEYHENLGSETFSADVVAQIPSALELVRQHFTADVIEEHRVGFIEVPLLSASASNAVPQDPQSGGVHRYWRVGRNAHIPTHSYDSQTRKFSELPTDRGFEPGSDDDNRES